MFLECSFDFIEVICVENEGRDIVPFFGALKTRLFESKKYDVIGHFHSKKSLDNDTGFGDKWLNYLTANLLGNEKNVNQILGLFSDENLGLVFAADHHIVGFGENKCSRAACRPGRACHFSPLTRTFKSAIYHSGIS
jgi:lipopolysaccharide biosynthesis protein